VVVTVKGAQHTAISPASLYIHLITYRSAKFVPLILNKPKLNMLLIDDDRAILRIFKRILERKGYNVATAETGKQAQAQLETHSYYAALIDLKLPDMEGTDLLPQMQQNAPQMMRIILTGMPYAENAQNAFEAGADVFLEKPVNPEILLAILEKGLKDKAHGVPSHND
jgi:DNA-binding NtrC family response regulator